MLTRVSGPSGAVLDLASVKRHCRVDSDVTDFDAELTDYMTAAEAHVETLLGRRLLTQRWRKSFAAPDRLQRLAIDLGPNISVQTVQLLQSGAYATLVANTDYVARPWNSELSYVRPPYNQQWPVHDEDEEAFVVIFDCGYGGAASAVPAAAIAAMKLIVGDLFSNRDASRLANVVDNPAVDRLLSPLRASLA